MNYFRNIRNPQEDYLSGTLADNLVTFRRNNCDTFKHIYNRVHLRNERFMTLVTEKLVVNLFVHEFPAYPSGVIDHIDSV